MLHSQSCSWVRTAIFSALLSAQKFPHNFTFWRSRASPRNSFQMRRNSNFDLSFFPTPVLPVFYPVGKPRTSSAWKQLPFQIYLNPPCPQEAVLALSTPAHRRRAPHSPALAVLPGSHPCNPAQEGGQHFSPDWLKYQGYVTADDGHQRGSLHQIQKKSRAPCKQRWGEVAKMCPFQPEHPLASWSYRAGEIFAAISLNNPHNAAIAYLHTIEETAVFSLFLWIYKFTNLADLDHIPSTNSKNCNFVVVYWITDNKEFRRRSSEPYSGIQLL